MNKKLQEMPRVEQGRKSNPRIRRIVVATDLSEQSEKTTAYAVSLAQCFGASVTIVHAFEPEEIALATPEVHELLDDARREAELTLIGVVEGIRRSYPNCEMEFRVGEPAEQIALMAKTLNADLVVTASHNPGLLAGLLGTDQAPRIMRSVHCPVLVYRESKI
jgi:nucleotide-binding universal stress UspA family protein